MKTGHAFKGRGRQGYAGSGSMLRRSRRPPKAKPEGHKQLPDYSVYVLSPLERIMCVISGAVLFFGIGYLFYHQWLMALVLSTGGLLVPRFWRKHMLQRRRAALNLHFKQAFIRFPPRCQPDDPWRTAFGRRFPTCGCSIRTPKTI